MNQLVIDHKAAARAAIATHTREAYVSTDGCKGEDAKAAVEAWHLLCSLIELCDAEKWNFEEMVQECREALFLAKH
jgi:hypothetical protein